MIYLFSLFICFFNFIFSCGELSAGSDSRDEDREESFYTKRKSQLNVIFSVLGTPEEVR